MNILMINGSMRYGSTYRIGKMLVERIALPGDTVNELFLPKDLPEFCRGCGNCIQHGEKYCPDYVIYTKRIAKYLEEADVLVFTTPTYVCHASGQMKAFLDHFGYQWMVHRPNGSMFHKQAVCISTAAGSGMKQAVKDIETSLKYWGVAKIYKFPVRVAAMDWDDVSKERKDYIDKQVYKLMDMIKREPEKVKTSVYVKVLFHIMRKMHLDGNGLKIDRRYWKDNGWLGKKRPWKSERR